MSKGTPMRGDRAAWDAQNFPAEHAADLEAETPTAHTPPPGGEGNLCMSDGTKWISAPFSIENMDFMLKSVYDPDEDGVIDSIPDHAHSEADISDLDHDAVKLQGNAITDTAPEDGQVLSWNDSGGYWEPQTPSYANVKLPVMGTANTNATDAHTGNSSAENISGMSVTLSTNGTGKIHCDCTFVVQMDNTSTESLQFRFACGQSYSNYLEHNTGASAVSGAKRLLHISFTFTNKLEGNYTVTVECLTNTNLFYTFLERTLTVLAVPD